MAEQVYQHEAIMYEKDELIRELQQKLNKLEVPKKQKEELNGIANEFNRLQSGGENIQLPFIPTVLDFIENIDKINRPLASLESQRRALDLYRTVSKFDRITSPSEAFRKAILKPPGFDPKN